jgi:hypothetical protein
VGRAVSAAGDFFHAADGQGGPAGLMAGAESLAGVSQSGTVLELPINKFAALRLVRFGRTSRDKIKMAISDDSIRVPLAQMISRDLGRIGQYIESQKFDSDFHTNT